MFFFPDSALSATPKIKETKKGNNIITFKYLRIKSIFLAILSR